MHDILKDKPPAAMENTVVQKLYSEYLLHPKPKEELIKVALFSDMHIEFDYEPSMNANCAKPTCCRKDSGFPMH